MPHLGQKNEPSLGQLEGFLIKKEWKTGRGWKSEMYLSEVIPIIIYFHQSHYRDFKAYYIHYVQKHLTDEFPNLVSYNRFVELWLNRVKFRLQVLLLPSTIRICNPEGTAVSYVDKICRRLR